jgi:GT2 family glycosyltransferase
MRGRKRWLVGRARRLEPKAIRDIERSSDGHWAILGRRPLVALVPVDGGPAPVGDVRIELEMFGAESMVHATLVVDTGEGFATGQQVPLPLPRSGSISAVVTLPTLVVAIGLDPGPLGTFKLGSLRLIELSAVGAVLAHAVPQMRRSLRNPAALGMLLGRAVRLLRYRGFRGVVERLRRGTQRQLSEESYEGWAQRYSTLRQEQRDKLQALLGMHSGQPTFSLLLGAGHFSESALRRTLNALERQSYPNWELCLAEEEASAEVRELVGGFAAQARLRWAKGRDALGAAGGELVVRLEAGDALAEHALLAVAAVVVGEPELALLYTDTDGEDASGRVVPAFKPEWSPELLHSRDYIGRAAFLRTERVRTLGGWRSGPGDVPQHELLLRYTAELPAAHIFHLPAVLMHTRPASAPTSDEIVDGVQVVQASLDAAGAAALVEPGRRLGTYRVRYAIPRPPPLVTVVIPTRDRLALLKRCVKSMQDATLYRPLELLVVDNESREARTLSYLQELEAQGAARVLRYPHPFNFSAMNNLAARESRGELLCLLNNDVEAIEPGWLTEMVGLALQPGVGAVGAKLLYPDNTVQHAGTVAGLFGVAAHGYLREARDADGYLLQLQTTREVVAVTAACMVVRRELYLKVGCLDETELPVAFNDMDLCFKLLQAGYRNVWTPYAELYHRESASRGNDERRADRQRFLREESVMRGRWGALIARDPYFSPNLSLDSNLPRPAWPPRARWPWTVEE